MNFQKIPSISKGNFYLDVAIERGKKHANGLTIKTKDEDKKSLIKERERVKVVKDSLVKSLSSIITSFPGIDGLSEFYYELCVATFDVDAVKQGLSTVSWAVKKICELESNFSRGVKGKKKEDIIRLKKSFFGRVSSIIKRLNGKLDLLENTRRVMLTFPDIKDDLFTVCICGFPNVGKSTLLTKITTSTPEIGSYAFTTKSLNTGYFMDNFESVQVVDVPGTLNRFERMNNVEKQAHLAIKYLANVVVYVYDLTEPYSIEEQNALFDNMRGLGKDVVVYFSKVDLLGEEKIKQFIEDNKIGSAVFNSDDLKNELIALKRRK